VCVCVCVCFRSVCSTVNTFLEKLSEVLAECDERLDVEKALKLLYREQEKLAASFLDIYSGQYDVRWVHPCGRYSIIVPRVSGCAVCLHRFTALCARTPVLSLATSLGSGILSSSSSSSSRFFPPLCSALDRYGT
jgi:hypothetical protein